MAKDPVETYAAVDLGSNSFHMIVATYAGGRLQVIDRIKKMVRLASGLDANDMLSEESMQRAVSCLEEFGQRIRELPKVNVRAVGTNTLRQARNGRRFMARARKALGHPIEIIAGLEEARLIYLGVANTVYDETGNRLVIDIGGGSSEIIIGKGFEICRMESLYVGCVNMSRRFFGTGVVTRKNMQAAILGVRQELEAIEALYEKTGWTRVIGSSGTVLAINRIIESKGWSNAGITREALYRLKDEVTATGNVDQINLPGLSSNRKPVFAGGLAILCGLYETFGIEQMGVSEGALREGLLYDLIGRHHDRDIRDTTIAALIQRYNIDEDQAARVAATVVRLHGQVAGDWKLDEPDLKFLEWGAGIHEIGLAIAHAQYHRHGAYLIAHSDMAGFSREDQARLALLVRSHRRKYPLADLAAVADEERDKVVRLCILLRLAILMNRSRLYASLPEINARADTDAILLDFPPGWLENNPLTRTDLESESGYMKAIGYKLITA